MFARFTTKKEVRSLVPFVTVTRIPEVAYVEYVICTSHEVSSLYEYFCMKQHEYDWAVRCVYDVDTTHNTGIIFFNVPSRKAAEELRYVASEQGLRARTIFNS